MTTVNIKMSLLIFYFLSIYYIIHFLTNDHNNNSSSNTNRNLYIKGNKDFVVDYIILYETRFSTFCWFFACCEPYKMNTTNGTFVSDRQYFTRNLSHELWSITFDYVYFSSKRFSSGIVFPTIRKSFHLNILLSSCAQHFLSICLFLFLSCRNNFNILTIKIKIDILNYLLCITHPLIILI